MSTATKDQQPISTTGDDESEVLHITGRIWEGLVIAWLSRRRWIPQRLCPAPRALCGEFLWGDPDRPDPGPNAPLCPACVERTGRDPDYIADHSEYIPGHMI